jgi:hypothetical protein
MEIIKLIFWTIPVAIIFLTGFCLGILTMFLIIINKKENDKIEGI